MLTGITGSTETSLLTITNATKLTNLKITYTINGVRHTIPCNSFAVESYREVNFRDAIDAARADVKE